MSGRGYVVSLSLLLALVCGCDLPGRPKPGPEVPRPEAKLQFDGLYNDNCAGCHGPNGQNGSATNLANPVYESWIDDASLRDVIANGEKGSLMPAFSTKSGGNLTNAQIDAIVSGMRGHWRKSDTLAGLNPPPYRASSAAEANKGQAVYAAACAQCHGATAQKPGKAGSILDGSFLALVNEQTLRTTIVAGRPDIGEPDWRNHIAGRPMTDAEVTNVVAWMIAQRPATPGQPYANPAPSGANSTGH